MYDIFISHASEDKGSFVRPLAQALKEFGLRVWYDEFSLRLGDSLSRSIDKGLSQSSFGVVVLSSHFLAKPWPEYELRGLTAKEIGRTKTVLPVWHGVSHAEVLAFSPPLADKYAIDSSGISILELATQLVEIVRPDLFERIQLRIAYLKAKRTTPVVEMNIEEVKLGPLRHAELPRELIGRIRVVRAAFLDVYTHSMKYWVDGFRGDAHPSNEVTIWEHMAAVYLEFKASACPSPADCSHAFRVLMSLCFGEDVRITASKSRLSREHTVMLIRAYSKAWPPDDNEEEEFPGTYAASADDLTSFASRDQEHFPDVPDHLLEELLREEPNAS